MKHQRILGHPPDALVHRFTGTCGGHTKCTNSFRSKPSIWERFLHFCDHFNTRTLHVGVRRKHMVEICGCSAAHTTTEMHESCTDSFRSEVLCLQEARAQFRGGARNLVKYQRILGHPCRAGPCRNLVKHQRILGIPQISLSNFAAILLQFYCNFTAILLAS